MKICNICKDEKELELFKKDNRRIDGYSSSCKECICIKSLEYYHRTKNDRKDSINENRRRSYKLNKDVENKRSQTYKNNNSDKIKEYNKEYQIRNREILSEKSKEYYRDNKEVRYAYSKNYIDNRLKNDEMFRLKHHIRSMIRKPFKRGGYSKKSKTQEILGCSFEEFKLYLESMFEPWMSWENYGKYNGELNHGWDIDHKIPLSSALNEEEVINLNHFSNLQPLCSFINRYVKKDKYIKQY